MELLEQEQEKIYTSIDEQIKFRNDLFKIAAHIKAKKKDKFDKKKALLKKVIAKDGDFDMVQFDKPRPMPIDPDIHVKGVDPTKCTIFKSAMTPLLLTFHA